MLWTTMKCGKNALLQLKMLLGVSSHWSSSYSFISGPIEWATLKRTDFSAPIELHKSNHAVYLQIWHAGCLSAHEIGLINQVFDEFRSTPTFGRIPCANRVIKKTWKGPKLTQKDTKVTWKGPKLTRKGPKLTRKDPKVTRKSPNSETGPNGSCWPG